MFQRRFCGISKLHRKDTGDTIVVGILHQENGLELLSWTIHAVARPGDVVVALVVSVPFSTFLIVDSRTKGSGRSKQRGERVPQLRLGELRELCAIKQIKMEVRFCVGHDAEDVVLKQAGAVKASILVITSTAKFTSRSKRIKGSYGAFKSLPECTVLVVRNGKALKEKSPVTIIPQIKVACFCEGMQTADKEQATGEDAHENSSKFFEFLSRNSKGKSNSWSEPDTEKSCRKDLSRSPSVPSDNDHRCSLSSPHPFPKKTLFVSKSEGDSTVRISRWGDFTRFWKSSTLRYVMLLRSRINSKSLITRWSSSRLDPSETDYLLELRPEIGSMPLITGIIWKSFTLKELESATNKFARENFLGKGGYAEVYKGIFPKEGLLAVKRLTRGTREEQRVNDFLIELGIIVHIDHPNTARLVGLCVEGGLHLVFDFFPCGSLASMLHGPNSQLLDWKTRYQIALGIAKGLLYLHEGCQRRIIHRDIKASNILLSENFEPQISDFGLAKWLPDQWSHLMITEIEGTFGYLAPEYFMYGIVDEKTDVFAYGVVLLELITGRLPIDSSQQNLVMWAKPLLECGNVHLLVDPRLGDSYNFNEVRAVALTASLCVQQDSVSRPSMKLVVDLLNRGDIIWQDLRSVPDGPLACSQVTLKYPPKHYQTELNRHREVALGL